MKRLALLLVLTAAVLWGANGLFVAPLQDAGLSGTQITCVRFIAAATGAFAICAAKRCSLRIGSLRDATWFALNGVAGVFLFGLFYTYAIQATGMATAAVLIYLMPSFVMAFSVFTRREPCTARKVLCLAMSLLGCALASGVAAPGASVAPVGVLFGVLAALFYACNNIVQAGPLEKLPAGDRVRVVHAVRRPCCHSARWVLRRAPEYGGALRRPAGRVGRQRRLRPGVQPGDVPAV